MFKYIIFLLLVVFIIAYFNLDANKIVYDTVNYIKELIGDNYSKNE